MSFRGRAETRMSEFNEFQKNLPGLRKILSYFWPQVRQHRGLIVGAFAALFIEVGLRLLEPWPLKFVFDRVIHDGSGRTRNALPFLDGVDRWPLLKLAAVAVVVVTG